jgi:superfamily I DNA/RNA helicase
MPSSHVAYLKSLVPEYPIEAWEHAKEGTIETLSASQLVQVAQDGDMVLCRRNAPLVGYAFELLRQGIKAVILGRDIASNLTTIIGKVQKQGETGDDLNAFLRALDDYAQEQVLKLEHAGRTNQAQTLDDKCSTIMVIAENDCKNVQDILIKIDLIFSKDRQGVTFASVHKAKGLEAQRIFLLKPQELGSTSRCSNQDECDQERNIMIVALSRSKSALYFVSDEAQGKLW